MRYPELMTLVTVGGALACGADAPPAVPPLPVTVAEAAPSPGRDEIRYSGAIEADASVDVAFRVSGVVEQVTLVKGADGRTRPLQEGDLVRRGQPLARLRQMEFSDQAADAEATLRQAEADYERAAQLYENRSVAKADYDAAYARYSAARARKSQAMVSLGDATLRAPITGVILRRSVEAGSLAGPSAPAFTVADTRMVKVVFGVPDVVVAGLQQGGALAIQAEAMPGEVLVARIAKIAPSADPASRVFEVEAALPNPDGRMKVGMLAALRLGPASVDSGLYVPLAAVVRQLRDSSSYAVYAVDDSAGALRARLRAVRLGEVRGNLIAVCDGLTPGERVIVRGATIVTDGQPVRITQ